MDHLTSCSSLNNTWTCIIEDVIKDTKNKISKYLNLNINIEQIKETILAQRNTENITDNNLIALVRGFTSESMVQILGNNIKGSNKVTSIFKNIINKIQEGFHKQI